MKSFATLLAFASIVAATPFAQIDSLQQPLSQVDQRTLQSYPGIDLDLNERRIVQLENDDQLYTVTELEKVPILFLSPFLRLRVTIDQYEGEWR